MKDMKEIKDVDRELTKALRREEPPAGFAERVLRRATAREASSHEASAWDPASADEASVLDEASVWDPASADEAAVWDEASVWDPASAGLTAASGRRRPVPVGFFRLAAAAAIVAAVAGSLEYRAMQRERAEGEAAKARVVLALQIAGSKLQLVQSKITRMHEEPAKNSNQ